MGAFCLRVSALPAPDEKKRQTRRRKRKTFFDALGKKITSERFDPFKRFFAFKRVIGGAEKRVFQLGERLR